MSETFNTNKQDMFASDYRLYIEGVQVPFESVHISNVYNQFPTASITMPPWPGLQDLGRNYMPKVDVFWRDYNYGVSAAEASTITDSATLRDTQRDAYKLIFSGVISGTSDSKMQSPESAQQSMTLNCTHQIVAMQDILVRFGNQSITAAQAQIDNSDATLSSSQWDINTMMIKALMGVSTNADPDSVNYIDPDKLEALKGTPGMLHVMWQCLRKDSTRNQGVANSKIMTDIYIPMIEDGFKLWERMTGHPAIEGGIHDGTGRVGYNKGVTQEERDASALRGVDPELTGDMMVPAAFRSFIGEAAQKELAIAASQSLQAGAGSPEASSFMDHFMALLQRLEYDMTTLSAPISRTDGSSYEYIVKPELSNYYAPICNVVLPNLLTQVQVNSNYDAMPSRTVNLSNIVAGVSGGQSAGAPSQQYTSPHSVRYSRAGGEGSNLQKSLWAYNNSPGRYEYGSGVKCKVTQLPNLYNLMQAYQDSKETAQLAEGVVGSGLAIAAKSWDVMYPDAPIDQGGWPGATNYNPLGTSSGISSFNRLNFMYSDQQFAMETHKARTAQASGVFNPYAVVGYPMDFIDSVPSRESYHGLCTSVSHTIHASGSASTSYGMSGATTFSELALYNLPAVNPYLSSVFDLDESPRIYKNAKAYAKACRIYLDVFGVGAAEPALLQEYYTGTTIPFTRTSSSGCWTTSESTNFLDSVQGSLMLVARNIRTLKEYEDERFINGLTGFIDIADWIDSKPDEVVSVPSVTRVEMSEDGAKILTQGIDAESSPFLDYI